MKNRIIRSLALLTFASFPLLAQPAPPANTPNRPPQPPSPLGRCLAVVDLSEAQKTSVKAVFDEAAPRVKALHERLRSEQQAVRAALDAPTPDACALGNAILKVEATQEALRSEAEATKRRIEAILTSDQKLKLSGCLEGLEPPRPDPRD